MQCAFEPQTVQTTGAIEGASGKKNDLDDGMRSSLFWVGAQLVSLPPIVARGCSAMLD
jgi:hypothetical protein